MSDYFNSFANPQGGGGQDIPQPGTPAWAAWLQSIVGQGPMAGQQPGRPMMASTTPIGGQPPPSSAFSQAGPLSNDIPITPNNPVPDYQGKLPGAHDAPPPPISAPGGKQPDSSRGVQQKPPPVKKPTPTPTAYARPGGEYQFGDPRNPNPPAPAAATPVADSDMLYPARAATPGYGPPPKPAYDPLSGGSANTGAPPAVTPSTGPLYPASDVSLYPHALIPGAPSNGATPNLGYYRPTMGNAQGNPTWVPQGAQGSPQMFRGPLALPGSQNYYGQPAGAAPPPVPAAAAAAPATAPVPGPLAPGVGTLALRKMFPWLQPTA